MCVLIPHVLPGAPMPRHHGRQVTIHMKNEVTAIFLLLVVHCKATQLTSSAQQAFEAYVAAVEARFARETKPYPGNPALTGRPEVVALNVQPGGQNQWEGDLMHGEVRTEPVNGGTRQFDGALLHHWRGAAFIPGARAKDMVALLRGRLPRNSTLEIVSSRVLADDGETATLAVRFQKQVVIAIVIDAEYKVEAKLTGDGRGYGISRGTHFWQVDNPATDHERRRKEGDDDGFLWRLNSYWGFVEAREGLEIGCEAVSLTRDVPRGLGWLISPIVANLPRELLESTMTTTMNTLAKKAPSARAVTGGAEVRGGSR